MNCIGSSMFAEHKVYGVGIMSVIVFVFFTDLLKCWAEFMSPIMVSSILNVGK